MGDLLANGRDGAGAVWVLSEGKEVNEVWVGGLYLVESVENILSVDSILVLKWL